MILYEYKCLECSVRFQEFIFASNITCPSCQSKKVKKSWVAVSNQKAVPQDRCKKCNICGNKCAETKA